MLRTLAALLCTCFALPVSGKLNETVPQLVKRFGKSYTVEESQLGKTYKFRSANVSVDALVADDRSICETYFSNHPLAASGEPPNDIVRAILKTNVPKARWLEIDSATLSADYALESSDHKYRAVLRYKGLQPESSVWTMTVGSANMLSAARPPSPPNSATSSPAAQAAQPAPDSPVVFSSATPAATPAPTVDQFKQLIQDMLHAFETNNSDEIASKYADKVNYRDYGVRDRDFIRNDLQRYFVRWPLIRIQFDGDVKVEETKKPNEKILRFKYSFTAASSDRRAFSDGVAHTSWWVWSSPDGLKIFAERQKVVRRGKP